MNYYLLMGVAIFVGGLVQRNTGTSQVSSGATGGDPPGAEGGMDMPEKDFDDEGGDSKTVRLTLMEEVLLLGLKDREVK